MKKIIFGILGFCAYMGLCLRELDLIKKVIFGDVHIPAGWQLVLAFVIGIGQLLVLSKILEPYVSSGENQQTDKPQEESKVPNSEQQDNIVNKEKQPEKVITVEGILTNVDAMEGIQFEHYCGDLLKANGFSNIKYTEVTGDQGVDITAEKDNIKYAIQCKRYSSDVGNQAVQEVFAGKTMYGCDIGIVMTNGHFTSGAKALAKATHVALWDREILSNMIKEVLQNNNI